MTDLAKRTWLEAEELFGPETIALLPVGSTEPHGPHLPLDTDVTIACAQAQRAAEVFEARGLRSVVLPSVNFGLTNFTNGFAGTIGLRPGTLWALLEDVLVALEEQGVGRAILVNGHLEPEHVAILRGVIVDFPGGSGPGGKARLHAIFPDNTRRKWAATLGEEFQSGDCHAGRYETSIVLSADPEGVREEVAAKLPPKRIDLIEKMRSGKKSFKQCGADEAYCGNPADATATEGADLIGRLAHMVVASAEEAWPECKA